MLKSGIFGKEKLIEDLSKSEKNTWEQNVDNEIHSFSEMRKEHRKAYYLRLLLIKGES